MDNFEERLARLDISLFTLPTQSTDEDRSGWLAVQRAIRGKEYTYLETGSYLGGSIQQHLLDPLCKAIISIDNRPFHPADERDEVITYEVSTGQMLDGLRTIAAVEKITTFEIDASKIDRSKIFCAPDFCFIDGEHTHDAVVSDFNFCLSVCAPDAAICFHDARIIDRGLRRVLDILVEKKIKCVARRMPGDTFGIFLRNCPAATDPYILEHSSEPAPFFRKIRLRKFAKSLVPKQAWPAFKAIFPAP